MKHLSDRAAIVLSFFACLSAAAVIHTIPNLKRFQDKTGAAATFNKTGHIDENNPFFQGLGTNGRACVTCHQPDQAFSLSAKGAQEVYERTHGDDPLFASVDGANCPAFTSKDRAAHSLLLERGLIRVALPMPAHAQFTIAVVHDPYGCAITYDTGVPVIAVYRRPLPAANLRYLSAVMFDGRETLHVLNNAQTLEDNLKFDLTDQAMGAVTGHEQGVAPSAEKLAEIVKFEMDLTTAQIEDNDAGLLYAHGATGGPMALTAQAYYPGINDVLGGDPTGQKFNPNAFSLYSAWGNAGGKRSDDDKEEARAEIAAGEKLFDTAPLVITGVRGLNDNPALGNPASIPGTCTTCHDAPNVGNHSVALALDIATSRQTADETDPNIIAALDELSAPDLPVYEIRGCTDPVSGKQVNFYTSDPGKALISGLCTDVNRGKGPILRGLAARAPYFHNGAAADLNELVNFYDKRFQMNLTDMQKKELIAFLNSL